MNFKKILGAAVASVMAISTMAVAANAATAGITFQTSSYYFRNTIGQADCLMWDDSVGEAVAIEGSSFKDVEITGDGEYTVELNGVEDNGWNMLKIDTDLAAADYPNLQMTVKTVELDGTVVDFDATAAAMSTSTMKSDEYCDSEFTVVDAIRCQLINTYDGVAAIDNKTYKSVKVTFEITGMSVASGDNTAAGGDEGNGDTSAPTADKNTPDTGVEGVAAVAGIAVLAAGAIIVAKKRK